MEKYGIQIGNETYYSIKDIAIDIDAKKISQCPKCLADVNVTKQGTLRKHTYGKIKNNVWCFQKGVK